MRDIGRYTNLARDPLTHNQSSNFSNSRPLHDITPEEVLKIWGLFKYTEKLAYAKIRTLTHEINHIDRQIKECKDEEKKKQLEEEKRKKEEKREKIYDAINQAYLSYVRFIIHWREERKKHGKGIYIEKRRIRIRGRKRMEIRRRRRIRIRRRNRMAGLG